jgi:hypothetical protein
LDRSEIEHARRNPPAGTPAAIRGRYIREFTDDEDAISANWHAVYIGHGRDVKVVRLDRFHLGSAGYEQGGRKRSARREDAS